MASPSTPARVEQTRDRDAARRRRRRVWLTLAGVSIGWKLLVFSLGVAIPRWIVDDGIARLPIADQAYATEAKQTALSLWSGPIERHGVVRRVRVMSVRTSAAPEAIACGGRSARVRAYTYFAIPYSEVSTACDRGVVEYRVFRRLSGGAKPHAASSVP